MLMTLVRNRLLIEQRRMVEIYSKYRLKRQEKLWSALNQYIRLSSSTGCGFTDYWTLYKYVKKNKPREILECGTGVSTLVLAFALMELDRQGYPAGKITSMESHGEYLRMSKNLLPDYLEKYVEFCLSETEETSFSIFRE